MSILATDVQHTQVNIIDDRRGGESVSMENALRNLAVKVGAFFREHPEYITDEEKKDIDFMLGDKTVAKLNQYYEKLKTMSQAQKSRFFEEMWESYKITIQKCSKLRELIINSPFLIVVPDDQCRSDHGNPLVIRNVTIEVHEQGVTALVGEKLAAIRLRTQEKRIEISVICNKIWVFLNQQLPTPYLGKNINYKIITDRSSVSEETPLFEDSRKRACSLKRACYSCCTMLAVVAIVGAGVTGALYANNKL